MIMVVYLNIFTENSIISYFYTIIRIDWTIIIKKTILSNYYFAIFVNGYNKSLSPSSFFSNRNFRTV